MSQASGGDCRPGPPINCLWHAALEAAPYLLFLHDADGRLLAANQAYLHSAGMSERQALGQPYWKVFPRRQGALPGCRHSQKGLQAYTDEFDVEGRGFRSDAYAVRDEAGRYLYSIHLMTDITAERQAQRRLSEAQRIARLGSWEWDIRDDRLHWSEEIYRIFGLDPNGFGASYEAFLRAVHPEDRERVERSVKDAMEGRPYDIEHRIVRPDGSECIVAERGEVSRDAEGKPIRMMGTVQDITERMHAEAALRQAGAMFESTGEGVLVTDASGRIVRVNPAFTRITGYSEQDAIGKTTDLLKSGKHDDRFYRDMWEAIESQGYWEDEIWNRRKSGDVYPEWLRISAVYDEHGKVISYVGIFSDLSRIKESQEQLDFLAHYDPLTGLPNRLLFMARLEHALQSGRRNERQVALLFLDLDRFKNLNETLGHSAGDVLLMEAAERLREVVREEDTVARLGGDEFTLVLENVSDLIDVAGVVRKLQRALCRPLQIEDHELVISASVGVSLYPRDGEDPDTLVKHAEAAMYEAKRQGGNGYAYYTEELTRIAMERFSLEASLHQALERQEFELHYQPQVELATGRVSGVEALVRWRHPKLGLIPPDRFIPLAEETGLIIPLGEWVLRTACAMGLRLQRMYSQPLQVAVNLSGRQLADPGLKQTLSDVFAHCGLPHSLIELEVTEGALIPEAFDLLCYFRSLGVKIAIDDFGTGYSSLARIRQFPIDRLKIDRSFVQNIPDSSDDASIAKAIIMMAHSLNLEVVAEGVETEAQLEFLREHGCEQIQGYFFSRPLPEEELSTWLMGK